jgi:thiol-disulfide isomerase/thioredoxin
MRAIALTLLLVSCSAATRPPPPTLIPPASATALPELEYRLMSGEAWSSRASAGRVIVLDVWATYCAPCRKAFPKLDRLAATYPDVVVVGLSVDDDDEVVRRFLDEVPAGFAIARDPQQSVQAAPLSISRLPTVIVVDRRGRIRLRAEEMAEADYDALPGLVAALRAE